jgi:hypothetical protein
LLYCQVRGQALMPTIANGTACLFHKSSVANLTGSQALCWLRNLTAPWWCHGFCARMPCRT